MQIIRCPICKTNFRKRDVVIIDVLNTMAHRKCAPKDTGYLRNIKDGGTFFGIMKRYDV